jgi:N-acetylglutamate synthase-like GNAT family acetyltransferase
MELPKNFEYFERKTPNIVEKFIRKQGDEICQEKIGTDYIKARLQDYDFGFVRSSVKAQIGRVRTRQTEHHTYSFILCKLIPAFHVISITLVCSRTNSKDGKQLMELVEQKAKQLNYKQLSLIAIGNSRLLHWYESQGYVTIDDKPIMDSKSKAYSMMKNII